MGKLRRKDLHNYQLRSIQHIKDNTHCGLFLDMGLGKTATTLTAIYDLMYTELAITKVLVIAPKRVTESVWNKEVKLWSHLKNLRVQVVSGTEKQRVAALREEADVYTLGRDNVAWFVGYFQGLRIPFDCLVIDESSSFKNHDSQRFKALKSIQAQFERVIALTGTPAPNSLLDLWPQIWLLDRGERLGKTVTTYRRDYFREGARRGYKVLNYSLRRNAESMIHEAIKDICISMKAEDYLDLPKRIDNKIILEMPPKVKKAYEDFEEEQVLTIFGTDQGEVAEITALNAAALATKLLQFANGAIYDEEKNVHEVHKLKIDALAEILEDANRKPVLLAWTYRHDLARIKKAFGKKYKLRELKNDQDIEDWNNGEIELLLMHPASGGHGLNLQAGGNIIVWFGQTWSLELEQQLNARLHRQGQTKSVIINKLIVKGTFDERVIKALERKDLGQESLLKAVKARIDKYFKK